MGKVNTIMRSVALIASFATLAVAQQQGVGPASTVQLQPGQFSVFGQQRQAPVNIPGTQGQVVAQFIDETGQAIPIQQLGQPQQQQFQQQQQFRPAPVQQQQFRPAPQQQQLAPAAGSFRATANQQDAHQGHLQVHQQNLAIQQQQFSPEQRQALREFQASPPPPRAPQPAAPQPQRFQPPPQPQRFQPAPQQQFSQFPAQGAPQRRPEAPRAQAQAPRRQEPGSVNDALGQQVVAAEDYVHDPSGDATLSRFQLFQLRKKQEAQAAAAPQA